MHSFQGARASIGTSARQQQPELYGALSDAHTPVYYCVVHDATGLVVGGGLTASLNLPVVEM